MYKYFKYAVSFLMLVGSLVIASYYLISEIEVQYTSQQEATLKTISTATKATLKNWKKQVEGEFSLWLNSPVIYDFTESLFQNNIDRWLQGVLPFISADSVYFSDANGNVVGRSHLSISNNINSEVFEASRRLPLGDSVLNIVEERKGSGIFNLVFSFPLASFEDDIVGYAHFNLDSRKKLSDILKTVQFKDTGGVIAIDEYGGMISKSGSEYGWLESYAVPKHKDASNTINNVDRDGDTWIEYFSWSKDLRCWILIEIAYSEFFNIFSFISKLIVIFCALVCFVVVFIFSQFIYFSNKRDMNNLIYKNTFSDSSDIRLVITTKGRLFDWSKSANDLFSIESSNKTTLSDLGLPIFEEKIKSLYKTKNICVFDIFYEEKVFDISVNILKNDRDEFVLIEGRDTTRQAEYSAKIKEKEERLRTTMQATNQGYFDLNFKSGTEYFDSSLVEMLGYGGEFEVSRATLDSLIHPDDFHKVVQMNINIFESKANSMISCEARMRTKENKWRYILMKSKVITRDEKGQVARVVGAHTDITLRKRSELLLNKEKKSVLLLNQKLEGAAKIKDQFISTMSHELRTPLNSIISLSDLLLEDASEGLSDKQTGYIAVIERSGKHLLDIINDILDISKINSGEMELNLTMVNVEQEVKGVIAMVSSLAVSKDIDIKLGNAMSRSEILLDAKRFRQILLNLLSNAIKFTEENKAVGINCSNTSSKFTIEVWDEGIGVNKKNISKLFKPFVQIDSELNRSQEGTGLGLSLVKNMVELHGGQIEVESVEGVGTSFHLIFPVQIDNKEGGEANPVFV